MFRVGAKRRPPAAGVGSVAIPRGATRIADGEARDAYSNTRPERRGSPPRSSWTLTALGPLSPCSSS